MQAHLRSVQRFVIGILDFYQTACDVIRGEGKITEDLGGAYYC